MRRPLLALALLASLAATAQAQPGGLSAGPISPEVAEETRKILGEIDKHSQLMLNLEYLCDVIGPRLTGSANLKRANEWTRDKFKAYGLQNAHTEGWKIARSWTRGAASGRIVAPSDQRLLVESAGWSPGTNGPLRGRVVHLKGEKLADLDAYKGKLKGAWIITGPVSVQPSPKSGRGESPYAAPTNRRERSNADREAFSKARRELAVKEGAAGFLHDSNKEHGLVNMTVSGRDFTLSKLPEAFLTTESYGLIWRLLNRGPVTVEIDLKNTASDGEVEVYNTVAELVGTEKPDEIVVIGGHLDSWDLGTGATDNGTGTMAVLEAARALKAVGAKPKRTIRFVLWSGEEQGLHGSKAYAKAHESELGKVSAVLVHDMGTGRVTSIGLQGRYDLREVMDRVAAPFQRELRLDEMSLRNMGGTDHLSFHPAGVPAFAVVQDEAEYRKTHHTESDTFDKVYSDEVNQGAKVLAAWAYNVAMLPDLLPRDPKAKKPAKSDAKPVASAAAKTK
jgi:carboxypeptidase Q